MTTKRQTCDAKRKLQWKLPTGANDAMFRTGPATPAPQTRPTFTEWASKLHIASATNHEPQ
eukprot:1983882-Lingulodinium_polyedra.AAC.1